MLSTVAAVGSKPLHAIELEAGQLQHPGLGQSLRIDAWARVSSSAGRYCRPRATV